MADSGTKSFSLETVAAALAGGLAALGTVFTAIGSASGGIEVMFRNHPAQSTSAVLLVAASVTTAIFAYLVLSPPATDPPPPQPPPPPPPTQAPAPPPAPAPSANAQRAAKLLLGLGTVLFTGGIMWSIILAGSAPSTKERPTLSVKVNTQSGLVLEATVKASGLSSKEHIRVVVDGLVDDKAVTRLFDSSIGSGANGVVDQTLQIPIPFGTYEQLTISANGDEESPRHCLDGNEREGCAILWLPPAAAAPSVARHKSLDI